MRLRATLDALLANQHTIIAALAEINRKANQMATDQEHLDSTVAALDAQVTALTAAAADIATELAALKAQPGATALDFAALDGVVAKLGTATAAVVADAPVAAPPAP